MKYLGGKLRIANQLATEFNKIIQLYGIKNYYEPFVGGAAVIEIVNCENKYGNDINQYQIALLEHIKQGGDFPDHVSREEWRAVKDSKDNYPDWYVGYIGIVCSFNCKWFDWYGGEINGANGIYQNKALVFKNQLIHTNEVSKLSVINLTCMDYRQLSIPNGSIVYCDPPYADSAEYKDEFNSKLFYKWVIEQSKHSLVYISEYMLPLKQFKEIMQIKLSKTASISNEQEHVERLYVVKGGWFIEELYGEDAVGYNIEF